MEYIVITTKETHDRFIRENYLDALWNDTCLERLTKEITKKCNDGWEPVGGIFF